MGAAHETGAFDADDRHPSFTVLRPYGAAGKRSPMAFVTKVSKAAEDARERRRVEYQPTPAWHIHRERKRTRKESHTSGLRTLRAATEMVYDLFVKKFNLPLIPSHRRTADLLVLAFVHRLMDEDELQMHLPEILRIYEVETIMRYIVIMMPRRYGKSAMLEVIFSVILYFVPGYHLMIFAQSQEITTMLGNHIRDNLFIALKGTPGEANFRASANAQHVKLRNRFYDGSGDPSHFSNVTMVPGRVGHGHRGKTPLGMWVDEADFAHKIIWGVYVMPMISEKGKTLILTSTKARGGDDSMLERLANARDPVTGRPPFASIIIRAACDSCIAKNEQNTCRHIYVPPWIDQNQDFLAELVAGKDAAAELRNASDEGPKRVFHQVHVEFMCSMANMVSVEVEMPFFITAIDPGRGTSDNAIMSFVLYRRKFVVIGIDRIAVDDAVPVARLVHDHIQAIRNNPRTTAFRRSTSIIVIEDNNAMVSAGINRNLSRLQLRNYIMYAPRAGHIGVVTNESNKYNMVQLAQSHLEDRECVFMNFTACACAGLNASEGEVRTMATALRQQLKDQLIGFSSNPTVDERGRVHQHFGGKGSDAGNDDFVMSFLIFLNVFAPIMDSLDWLGSGDNPYNRQSLLHQNLQRMGIPR